MEDTINCGPWNSCLTAFLIHLLWTLLFLSAAFFKKTGLSLFLYVTSWGSSESSKKKDYIGKTSQRGAKSQKACTIISGLHHSSLAVWPWSSYLASLFLSFLTWEEKVSDPIRQHSSGLVGNEKRRWCRCSKGTVDINEKHALVITQVWACWRQHAGTSGQNTEKRGGKRLHCFVVLSRILCSESVFMELAS